MSDRGKYVDIFFRNGLKEFEVLPPPDVWDNIQPVLRKKRKSLNIVRFAAIATILLSISVLSFWMTNELSKNFTGLSISLNQDVIPSGSFMYKNQVVTTPMVEIPAKNSEIPGTVVVNEKQSSELINLMMPSAGLFSTTSVENKFQRIIKPIIPTASLIGNSNSRAFGSFNLITGKSVSPNPENGVNRWTISAMASPTYFSNTSFGKNDASTDLVNTEKPVVSYTGGMAFSYNANKRISFQSGVYYSTVGQRVTGINSYSGFNNYYAAKGGSEFGIQTSSGTIVSTNNDIFLRDNISSRVLTRFTSDFFDPVKANLNYLNNFVIQNFNYLEIPVLFKYKAIDRKIDLNFIGGLSYNMLVGNSAFAYVSGVKYSIGKTEGLSPVNFSSSLGLGFEYNFTEKISLNLEPTFRYYLTPLGGLIGSSLHPYSFGVFSGFSYKF